MPNSSPSSPPQQIQESDAAREASPSLNQETLNRPDPPPKSDPGNTRPPQPALDPDYNTPEYEEDYEEEEADEETPAVPSAAALREETPIGALHVSAEDGTLSPPSHCPSTRRGTTAGKRKKGKRSKKKQQAIEKKLESLKSNLNPIPFIPNKILDFAKHEKLLRKLGLWDFANVDFDRNIRADLLAQLVATYEAKSRASHVDDYRVNVSRADLARAFKLPKKGSNVSGMEADLECEALSDESIAFITELVNHWVLLHEDTWIMPKEVADWLQVIRDGQPEKVDWASLFWFMVEKEVKQGGGLRDCYYASHLQQLMKYQRKDLFLTSDVEDDAKGCEIIRLGEEGSCLMEGGPSTELTLGKDEEKGGDKDVEMMVVEKCKGSDDNDDVGEDDEEAEEAKGEEQRQWTFGGQKEIGEHFMRPCNAENAEESEGFELKNEDEDEAEAQDDEIEVEEDGDQFHDFPRGDDEVFAGNFLGEMHMDQLGFNPQDPLCNQSSRISSIPPFFNNSGKRVAEHNPSNEGSKKLRINNNELWDHDNNNHNKPPLDFGTCIEQMKHLTERARILYEEREQALEHSNMNQQILLNELQKRDSVIEHLHKTRLEEMQEKDSMIYRLERELNFMGDVLEGYRKALKETRRAFLEYRGKARVPEEPTYKDTGEGGLMLTSGGIENLRKMREDEFKMKCLFVEQKVKEVENDWVGRFGECALKVGILDTRLHGLENDLVELGERQKAKQREEGKVAEVVAEEKVVEDDEEKVVQYVVEEKVVEDDEEKVVQYVVDENVVQYVIEENVVQDDEENVVQEKVIQDEDEYDEEKVVQYVIEENVVEDDEENVVQEKVIQNEDEYDEEKVVQYVVEEKVVQDEERVVQYVIEEKVVQDEDEYEEKVVQYVVQDDGVEVVQYVVQDDEEEDD